MLITLGIIGIIAALTTPNLVASYQKKQTVVRLQKAYAVLNQAMKLAGIEHGDFVAPENTQAGAIEYLETYFIPYLQIVQKCFPIAQCGMNSQDYKWMKGNAIGADMLGSNAVAAIMVDGSVLIVNPGNSYLVVHIDINGKSGPNTLGKDLFRLVSINKDGLKLFGYDRMSRDDLINLDIQACRADAEGKTCGALIMHDGWEIKDDYPW